MDFYPSRLFVWSQSVTVSVVAIAVTHRECSSRDFFKCNPGTRKRVRIDGGDTVVLRVQGELMALYRGGGGGDWLRGVGHDCPRIWMSSSLHEARR